MIYLLANFMRANCDLQTLANEINPITTHVTNLSRHSNVMLNSIQYHVVRQTR